MDTYNFIYKGKLWRPCPTTSDHNSFFHSAFGVRASDGGKYFDDDAKFRRMRWATFLTYFENKTVPPLLADILRECLCATDIYSQVSIDDKQNFTKYVSDIMAGEKTVMKEEIPILATLENTTIVVFSYEETYSVVTIRPNSDILGSYRNALENPKEVALCLEGNVFSRLEPVNENPKPKSVKIKAERKTDPSKYKKGGSAGSKGVEYQISLLALVMLNALKSELDQWKLSTENEEAGKFDDVVLQSSTGDILIQSKHKENKSRITLEDLISINSKNDDFSIPKYFLSYELIKTKFNIKNIIICTNADVHGKVLKFLDRHEECPDNILHCEDDNYSIYTFNDKFLSYLKENVKKYYFQNMKNKNLDELVSTDEDLKHFLKRLQLYFNYPPRSHLEKNIERLLSIIKCCSNTRAKIFSSEIYPKVMDWFQQKDGVYLTEIHAKAIFSEIWKDKYCQMLEQYEVSFQKNDLNFQGLKQIFHITCVGGHLLQVIKIYRAIQDKLNILFVNCNDEMEVQKQVVQAFELPQYTFLIIIWSKTIEKSVTMEIYGKLKDLLDARKYKKVILVAEGDSKPAQQIGFKEVVQIDGGITFEELSIDTREKMLKNENINFQGSIISLRELFSSETVEYYVKYFHSLMLEWLIRWKEIKVGAPPLGLDKDGARYYINRAFIKETEPVESEGGSNVVGEVPLSEESTCQTYNKVMLISDDVGMGKTTVLNKLAMVLKEKKPHMWVIKINLNDYTRILRDALNKNERVISIIDLLNSQETTKMTNPIERFAFSVGGKVILLVDGIDEISPYYTDLILELLIRCQESKNFAKIVATTRPHVAQRIKAALKVGSYKMSPFTIQNQLDFLTRYWTHNLQLEDVTNKEKCVRYAKTLIAKMTSWVKTYNYITNPIAAIPLQVRMLAEIFQENNSTNDNIDWEGCKEYLQAGRPDPKLPENFNMAELYDIFIKKKRDVFVDKGSSSGNAAANQALIDKFEEYLAYHRSLAVKTILKKNQSDLFSRCHSENKDMETYVLKMGIVQKSGDELQFVHRTFAEYFVAQSILRELEASNLNVEFQIFLIDEILIGSEFSVIRAFLDNFLRKVVDSLPSTIFKNYQSSSCQSSYAKIIFILSEEGCVAILQLILKSINFSMTKKIRFSDTFTAMFQKTNTLNDIRIMMQTSGVNIISSRGNMPLHHAVLGGHLDMVKFLIGHGAFINSRSRAGANVLHIAARLGYLDIVKYLAESGAYIDSRDNNGSTILHSAADSAKLDIIKYLVERGANFNLRDNKGGTILYSAVRSGNRDVIKYLVELGVDIDSRDNNGGTALHSAVWFNNLNGLKHLVELGADINSRDSNDDTVLHSIARFGNLDTVKYLVNLGANINSRRRYGGTVLHSAVASGNIDTVKYLVELGLDISSTDSFGYTALHSAADSGNLDIVRYLVELGLDANVKDKSGCTPLHSASENGNFSVVKYFVEDGANIKVRDDKGRTVMHSAAKSGDLDIVKYLMECGVDDSIRDNDGYMASHLAADWRKWEVVDYLQQVGGDINTTSTDSYRSNWYTKLFKKNLK